MGNWYTVLGFFGGMFIIAVIDKLIPEFENPHEIHKIENVENESEEAKKKKLLKMGMLSDIAIAIHNIPEGIAVSIPLYFATEVIKKHFCILFYPVWQSP